jgi:hypothetical protein
MDANKQVKDTVFRFLFGNEKALRDLYASLTGSKPDDSLPLIINTLDDVLFKARRNDISFTLGDRLVVLIEHQSTINKNMPLRMLLYIARLYEKIVENKTLYKEKLVKIPRPEFIVLYNGIKPYADASTLSLKDAFNEAGQGKALETDLDLKVKVYNINAGHNPEILKKSQTLGQYSAFIAKIREFMALGGDPPKIRLDKALKHAIKWCIENGILVEFLKENASEVTNMLLDEWNWDVAMQVHEEEARETGIEEAKEEVAHNALSKGLSVDLVHDITGLDTKTIQELAGKPLQAQAYK